MKHSVSLAKQTSTEENLQGKKPVSFCGVVEKKTKKITSGINGNTETGQEGLL